MIHIQSFKDKLQELEKLKKKEELLSLEIRNESEKIKHTIVEILDEILGDGYLKTIKVDIKIKDKNIYKIEHKCAESETQRDLNFHINGINTLILWTDNSRDNKDSLWNFFAGGKENNIEIAYILDYLLIKYDKEYKNILLKKNANKYNL